MNPSVQKVFSLPELRELIFIFLLFDKNQAPIIPTYKNFRLVCKPWLETTNHLIYQNLRNLNDPYRDNKQYVPVGFNYDKISDFIKLVSNSCLKTVPALPFELELTTYKEKLIEGVHHQAITTLLSKYSDGLVKLNLSSPCNLKNLHLHNLQVLTATISHRENHNGFEKDIQSVLDGAQDSMHSFTLYINELPPGARVEPVQLPENLQSLCICSECDILHLEMLLSYNMNSVSNLQHLHISVSTQTTFSNPELLYQFLSECADIKHIYIGRHSWKGSGENTVICQLPLPKTLKQMECFELDLFGNILSPQEPVKPLETSKGYPKWKELKLRGFAKEDLFMWTTYYPCESLKRLKFNFEGSYDNREYISLGLDVLHLEKIHLAYPNLTYLEIWVENEKSLEYIFSEMTNLKTLHVRLEIHEITCINWDAVLIGCSPTEIKKLKEDYKNDANSVIFIPNEDLPSIRNMKDLQTLILCAEDSFGVVPDEYKLSEVAFLCAFLKMDSLLKLWIHLQNRISENIQQIWTSRPKRSIDVRKYLTEHFEGC